jgi:hypothetical protein
VISPSEHYAGHLHETSASAYLYCSLADVFREVGPESFKLYLLQTLEAAGSPSDPIERMLIEQICLAHHNIGRLHVKAATADHLEAERTYIGAAALLTGEFRRSVTALKAYRDRPQAATGPAPAAEADGPDPGSIVGANRVGNEQGSNHGGPGHGGDTISLGSEPAAGRGGPAEPGKAPRPVRRRPRQAS